MKSSIKIENFEPDICNMVTCYSAPYAKVEYDQNNNTIILSWLQQVNSTQYKAATQKALDALKEYNATYWISEGKNLKEVSPEDTQWASTFLVPSIAANGIKKLAFIIAEDVYKAFYTARIEFAAVSSKIEFQFFNSRKAAENWLYA